MLFFESIAALLTWRSLLDIALVAILIYQTISMLKGTRAAQVLIGMLVIFIVYLFSSILKFETLHWIISKFYSSFILVILILFQEDIRRLLTRFGKGPFVSGFDIRTGSQVIDEVINSAKTLSHERIGALIVFERTIGLDRLYEHSVKLDALISEQLIGSIFQSFSPLHDGAVIIQKARMSCASAQLPLSKNPRFSKKLGTRHSAAVGISEETDAVVLVVSEETGSISIAWEGNMQRQTSIETTRKMLRVLLIPRGERSGFMHWLEDNFFFKYNKFLLLMKKKIKEAGIHAPGVSYGGTERRKSVERRFSPRDVSSLESLEFMQIEHENKVAGHSRKNVPIHFPRDAKIPSLSTDIAFITNVKSHGSSSYLTIKKESLGDELGGAAARENDNHTGKNEYRFDPPIPTSSPSLEISLGEIPLSQEIEKDEGKDKKK